VTGAGIILPNFNADAGNCKQSLRIVPITIIPDDSLLEQPLTDGFLIIGGTYINF
jgi:hypothetical protein